MKALSIYHGREATMANDYEESEDVIDWDKIAMQPLWMRKKIAKGDKKPLLKKTIRQEKKDAEKKYRNKSV